MVRVHHWILIAVIASIIDCSAAGDEAGPTGNAGTCKDSSGYSWRASYLELGRETYQQACASCHDKGKDSAPVKGDSESWSGRSSLWCAVLLEHAKNGYLHMPSKGGQSDLSDSSVEAAAQYMLSETFPELQVD